MAQAAITRKIATQTPTNSLSRARLRALTSLFLAIGRAAPRPQLCGALEPASWRAAMAAASAALQPSDN